MRVQADVYREPLHAVRVWKTPEPLVATVVAAQEEATEITFEIPKKIKGPLKAMPVGKAAAVNEPAALKATPVVPGHEALTATSVDPEQGDDAEISEDAGQEALTAESVAAEEVQEEEEAKPEITIPDSYVNDYLGFTRTDLVSYLTDHAEEYLGTPYEEVTKQPVLGLDGHMQCEGFIWDAMRAVATRNETDIPCGNILTEPANGGGWVNWSYYHDVDPISFNTKEEMLSSGILEKGDVIWSFDVSGPYGLSNSNHVGFFWGDDPSDDKFWESAVETDTEFFSGAANGNRIAHIESMSAAPSVWWVFKLSPDESFDAAAWAGMPSVGVIGSGADQDNEEAPEDEPAENAAEEPAEEAEESAKASENETAEGAEEPAETPKEETAEDTEEEFIEIVYGGESARAEKAAAEEDKQEPVSAPAEKTVKPSDKKDQTGVVYEGVNQNIGSKETVFYTGRDENTGYYAVVQDETAGG
ncbi:MAG: hypothetical protein K5852_08355 [Eubacterium sp.]|nr:hypothetical protein [Eubacterium sp.]